jgi:hypothetical protein
MMIPEGKKFGLEKIVRSTCPTPQLPAKPSLTEGQK